MKRHLLFSLALASCALMHSCSKDKTPADEGEIDFELPYSKEGIAADKDFLETEGRATVKKMEALASEPAIEALQTLADLGTLDISVMDINKFGRSGQTVSGIQKMLSTVVSINSSAQELQKFSDSFGIYTYNAKTGNFDKTSSNDKIEVLFPAKKGAKSNTAKFTVTYQTNGKTIDLDGDLYEIPTAIAAGMLVDGKSAMELKAVLETHGDNMPKLAQADLSIGQYKATTNVSNESSVVKANFALLLGSDEILSVSADSKHDNLTYKKLQDLNKEYTETWDGGSYTYTEFDGHGFLELVKGSNLSFKIAGVQFLGSTDFSKLVNALPADPDYPEYPQHQYYVRMYELHKKFNEEGSITLNDYQKELAKLEQEREKLEADYKVAQATYRQEVSAIEKKYVEGEVAAFNNNMQLAIFNTVKSTKLATVKFQVAESSYSYDNNEIVQYYYDAEPVLVFGDKSQQSFDEFGDKGFGNLITDIESLLKKFER
ncbi:hypothetical protein ORI89_04440 [Sphingobacterium sp. UT-1RO-CII-1]|uniref:hypothetical protein n=1 Tax=Sphingobacterium sp. UT-1RO-CII-1 TaxID=2995225 RepID=UPI00227A345F|nr:hypothetical protein [Sphingobacterium sp. UT-1RO-CII-1]MCY4778886.1 hypothetical protein [Sphingobacterium sp. UT-1RO-CII-1]